MALASQPVGKESSSEHARLNLRGGDVLVVVNPGSGSCDRDTACSTIVGRLEQAGARCQVVEIVPGESLAERVRAAVRGGCRLVVAAGGDGTVSSVGDVLAEGGSDVPLGIIPLGTANVLAQEVGVPLDLDAASALLAGPHAVTRIDAMEVNGRRYLTQVGCGLDALMIRDTPGASKRRFGRFAYIGTALTELIGFQPRRFRLEVDGRVSRPRATQVLVANCGTLGRDPFRWGPQIRPDDGRVDVCVIRAATLFDYLRLAVDVALGRHRSNPTLHYLAAGRTVTIATRAPLPVQADGEIVGETPVKVRVVPGALRVVVPETPEAAS